MSPIVLALTAFTILHAHSVWAGEPGDIAGQWLTFDAESHAKRSKVAIVREASRLSGRIVTLYPHPDEDPDPVCDLCIGANKGRKVLGMQILTLEMAGDPSHFRGEVIDPEDGRTYSCNVTLEEGGQRLRLHGYVGVPLLGRTEVWSRSD